MMEVGVVGISNWTIGIIIQSDVYGRPGTFLSPVNYFKTFQEGDLFPRDLTGSRIALEVSLRLDAIFAP